MHRLVAPALLATALPGSGSLPLERLRERLLFLSRLLKYEFVFRTGAPFDTIVSELVKGFRDNGWVEAAHGEARVTEAGREAVALGSRVVRNYLEAYAVAASGAAASLARAKPSMPSVSDLLRAGEAALKDGRIVYPESVARSLYENATRYLQEQPARPVSGATDPAAGETESPPSGGWAELARRIWVTLA